MLRELPSCEGRNPRYQDQELLLGPALYLLDLRGGTNTIGAKRFLPAIKEKKEEVAADASTKDEDEKDEKQRRMLTRMKCQDLEKPIYIVGLDIS